jgi:hypothetical protein
MASASSRDLHDRDDRAEGLLAHDGHGVVDVDEDGRLEEVAAGAAALAADDGAGAFN